MGHLLGIHSRYAHTAQLRFEIWQDRVRGLGANLVVRIRQMIPVATHNHEIASSLRSSQ
jgi:hypothetical protein